MSSAPLVVILDKSDASVEAATLARLLPAHRLEALDLRTQEAALAHASLPLAVRLFAARGGFLAWDKRATPNPPPPPPL